MSYKIINVPELIEEREAIIAWYEQYSSQATQKFIIEYKNTLSKISQNPHLYRIAHKNYREAVMKKYPYYIIFYIRETENEIVVVKIYHTSRNPENKYKNLK